MLIEKNKKEYGIDLLKDTYAVKTLNQECKRLYYKI